MQIPGDELGRSWVQALLHEEDLFDPALLTLVTASTDDRLVVIGNAFIVYAHDHGSICLTAAHNFEFYKRLQQDRRPRSHPTLPQDFQIKGTRHISSGSCFAFCVIEGQPVSCKIGQINFIENYDVAVFTAHSDEQSPIFPDKLGIDLSMPNAGDEVALLGHSLSSEETAKHTAIVERKLMFLHGVITGVTHERDRKGQMFSFETTIPISPGLSGAPVLRKPVKGSPAVVCGLASFDFSEPEAFQNFRKAGHSTVAMLWPAMGFATRASIEGNEDAPVFLADLVTGKFITNHSNGVSVSAKPEHGRTLITYTDSRETPPNVLILDTAGHPLLLKT
jgi:hypothetical protein